MAPRIRLETAVSITNFWINYHSSLSDINVGYWDIHKSFRMNVKCLEVHQLGNSLLTFSSFTNARKNIKLRANNLLWKKKKSIEEVSWMEFSGKSLFSVSAHTGYFLNSKSELLRIKLFSYQPCHCYLVHLSTVPQMIMFIWGMLSFLEAHNTIRHGGVIRFEIRAETLCRLLQN